MKHLLESNLLRQSQHGFMSKKSCTTNLLEFLEIVTKAVDEGNAVDAVFLDFAKAFDKMPRKRLLNKLRAHGVAGNLLRWIANWLMQRRQRVVLNGRASGWQSVLSGVPQGSVLGPILFLIFINNLDVQAAMITTVKKFADDTKLGQVVRTEQDKIALQNCLNKLTEWADTWGMSFNVKKCMIMHFGTKNPKHPYYMNGEKLQESQEERDIGVRVSDTLKPSAQCSRAAQTARAVLGQLCRAFHYRDRHTFVGLYRQYVLPHLEFAVQAWNQWLVRDVEVLEKVQRRAVNMVAGLNGSSYEEKLEELDMLTMEERRHQADMVQVYKILHGHDNVDKNQWFRLTSENDTRTRLATGVLNLVKPRFSTEVRKNFFSVRVIDCWNSVPDKIKMARNACQFKRLYRAFRCSRLRPEDN
jgi:ribonuclease P/MRP protein subunit RPP40